ncbi:MAG TPA: hypothetical protein VNX15_02870 [Gemmatimonadales bacterium]|jgi:hypothetical protein|nr:hypothetical protein [Gemmatimonadales bacterium]
MSPYLIAGLSLVWLGLARPSSSQERVAPGTRVRVTTDSGPIVGSLVKADSTGLWVSRSSGPLNVFVPRRSVKTLEVSLGTRNHTGKGALVGFLIGAGSGVIGGLASGDDPPTSFVRFSAGDKAALLGVLFGGVGAGFGALVGSGMTDDDWHEVSPSTVRLSVRVAPGRAGLGVAISF